MSRLKTMGKKARQIDTAAGSVTNEIIYACYKNEWKTRTV